MIWRREDGERSLSVFKGKDEAFKGYEAQNLAVKTPEK